MFVMNTPNRQATFEATSKGRYQFELVMYAILPCGNHMDIFIASDIIAKKVQRCSFTRTGIGKTPGTFSLNYNMCIFY